MTEKNNQTSKRFMDEERGEAGFNISWGAVFAGVVTFLAIFATLSLIGYAIGLGIFEPTSSEPFENVGTGVLVWMVFTFILSFLAGGFVAGVAARRVGLLHGFTTWATSVILLMIMVMVLFMNILSGLGTAAGGAANIIGQGIGTAAQGAGQVAQSAIDEITDNWDDVDTEELQSEIEEVLEDTDVPELQPEYINNEIEEAQNEIAEAGRQLLVNPEDSDQILNSLVDSLQQRAETIADAADRDAIAEAVESNTELSESEAEEATDNIYNALQNAAENAEAALTQAEEGIEEAQQTVNQIIEDARQTAEELSDTLAEIAGWTFAGLVIGAILSAIGGILGTKFARTRREANL